MVMNDQRERDSSRRTVVAGLTTGLVATVAAGAAGQPRNQATAPAAAPPREAVLKDPLQQYPRPPFPKQRQEWPGLTSKMTPRPDHGEQSYKGSGRLRGRK